LKVEKIKKAGGGWTTGTEQKEGNKDGKER
jgi:hypothetical protein